MATNTSNDEVVFLRAQVAHLEQLLKLQERTAREQKAKLEAALEEVRLRAQETARVNTRLENHISERNRIEAGHREAEALWHSLVENIPFSVFRKDAEGKFTFVNKLFAQALGATPEAILGKTDADFFPPKLAEKYSMDDQRVMEKKEILEDIEEFQRGDGRNLYVHVLKSPVLDFKKDAIGIQGAFWDITARKQAEEERDRFFNLSLDMLCIAGFDGYFKRLNPAWEKCLGFSLEELLARPYMEFIHPDDRGSTAMERQKLATGGTTISFENRYLAKDGSYRWLLWNAVPSPEGHLVYAAARDITQRKWVEEERKHFAAKLEQSNRELQDFASVASHDLQEPLRKIQAFGDRLKAKYAAALADEGRDYLERMQKAAARMQNLINDLLTFSRVASRALPFVPIDLSGIAREVLADLEVRIEQTRARVEVGNLPVIEADPLQMRQLIQNLVGNALKFHRPGETPVILIQGQLLPKPDGELAGRSSTQEVCLLTVADNGIGFEEKYLDRIFNVFQRLHGRSEYEGTGIGLAVCRRIAERHEGSITAKSRPGQGATFIVTLPAQQARKDHTP